MLEDVRHGLSRPQKELSPKYFYDERGSELFEQITALDAYYPTRTERRLLLSAMEARNEGGVYVPVDVSADFLQQTADRIQEEYPKLDVRAAVMDISAPFRLPADLPTPSWTAFLGSTVGNFTPPQAVRLLQRIRAHLGPDDRFLLGVDQRPGARKSVATLEAAYNDEEGVTAQFNLNMLTVLNRLLGANFDPGCFDHRAFYASAEHRIEMHLVARKAHEVDVAGTAVRFEQGESIRTEISCKHDRASIEGLLGSAGMQIQRWSEDEEGLFALLLAGPTPDDVR
jgi:L-histidine N-alpha-methyltransferase